MARSLKSSSPILAGAAFPACWPSCRAKESGDVVKRYAVAILFLVLTLQAFGQNPIPVIVAVGHEARNAFSKPTPSIVGGQEPHNQNALASATTAGAVSAKSLADAKKIFIEPMANQLDQYIRVEFEKQLKNKITIVLNKDDADAILTGTGEWQKGAGATLTGRWLGLHDTATGAVSLVSADGNILLWASEAGDRSIWWGAMARGGPRKVASRLIHKLKADIEKAAK